MEPGSFLPENPSSKVSQVSGDEDFNARAQEFLAKIEKFQSFFSRHSSGVEGYKCASGNPEVADGGGCLSGLLADTGLSSIGFPVKGVAGQGENEAAARVSGGRDVILLKSPVESVISGKERKELSLSAPVCQCEGAKENCLEGKSLNSVHQLTVENLTNEVAESEGMGCLDGPRGAHLDGKRAGESTGQVPNLGQISSSAISPLKSTAVPTRPGSFMESLSKAQGLGSPSFLGRSGHMDSPAGCTSPGGPNQAGAELAAKPGFSYANAVRTFIRSWRSGRIR